MNKLLDIGDGLAIYSVHLDNVREMDKNARIMSPGKFERLVQNISTENGLESLPLGYKDPDNDRNEILVVSGHHRTRACRTAGILEIHMLVYEKKLTMDELKAKQLAHNSLSGQDDPQLLREIYDSIANIDAQLESGITANDLMADMEAIAADNIVVEMDFEPIYLMFMSSQKKKFDDVISKLEKDATVYTADLKLFERFKQACTAVSLKEDVRSISAIMVKMCEIIEKTVVIEDDGGTKN